MLLAPYRKGRPKGVFWVFPSFTGLEQAQWPVNVGKGEWGSEENVCQLD